MILLYNSNSKRTDQIIISKFSTKGANMNNKEENNIPKTKGKNKNKKPQNDINEEQIIRYVQREFIKAYMTAYAQREVKEKELVMFTKYLKNIKQILQDLENTIE